VPSINALLSNPEYSKLSDEDKAHARLGWFDANVASSPSYQALGEEDRTDALNGFEDMVREFRPEAKHQSLPVTAGKALAHGTLGLGESLGTGLEYAGNRMAGKGIEQEFQRDYANKNQYAQSEPTGYHPMSEIKERKPYQSEQNYFFENPNVAGMATEDNSVILNPFNKLSDTERQSVLTNERARAWMRNGGTRPDFKITPEQKEAFKDYSKNEQDVKETIAARILSGDPSVKNVTEEQRKWVETNLSPKRAGIYDKRKDGTPKGRGFLGELKRPDGGVSTELSIGVSFNGKETEIPLLVPTLSKDEVDYLLSGKRATDDIVQKAVDHAKGRMASGKSPFADDAVGYRTREEVGDAFDRGEISRPEAERILKQEFEFSSGQAPTIEKPGPVKTAIGEAVSDVGKTTAEYWSGAAKKFGPPETIANKTVWDNPKLLKSPEWWVYNTFDMVPSFAATIVPSAGAYKTISVAGKAMKMTPTAVKSFARLGASVTGGTVGGSLEGAQTYKTVLKETGNEEEAARAAEQMALFSAGLNSVSNFNILGKAAPGFLNRVKRAGITGLIESFTEGGEEPAEVMAKIGAKMMTGQEMPENVAKMFADSLKEAVSVMPVAGLTGAGGSVVSGTEATETKTDVQPETKSRFTTDLESGKTTVEKLQAIRAKMPPNVQADIDAAIAAYKPKETPFSFPAQTPEELAAVESEFKTSQQEASERARRDADQQQMDAVLAESAERRRKNQEILDAKDRVAESQQKQQAAIDAISRDERMSEEVEKVKQSFGEQKAAPKLENISDAVLEEAPPTPDIGKSEIDQTPEEIAEQRTRQKRIFSALSQIWDTLSETEQDKAIDLILPKQDPSAAERQAKSEQRKFEKPEVLAVEAQRKLKEAERTKSLTRPDFSQMKETGRWAEDVRGTATAPPPATPPSVAEAAPIQDDIADMVESPDDEANTPGIMSLLAKMDKLGVAWDDTNTSNASIWKSQNGKTFTLPYDGTYADLKKLVLGDSIQLSRRRDNAASSISASKAIQKSDIEDLAGMVKEIYASMDRMNLPDNEKADIIDRVGIEGVSAENIDDVWEAADVELKRLQIQEKRAGFRDIKKPEHISKEPWQMTRDEFVATANNEWMGTKPTVLGERYKKAKVKPGDDISLEMQRQFDSAHRKIIEKALSDGKPVPPEVMGNYPDLQVPKQAPIPVQETAPVQENGTAAKTEQAIPQFKTTNEAVAFGEQATPEQVSELERLRTETVAKEAEYKAAKDFSVDRTNNAFAGQLYREALEASRGEHPLQRDKRTPDQMLEDGKSKGVDIAQQYDNKLGELSTLKQQARDAGGTEADIRAAEDSGRRSGTPEAPATGGVQAEADGDKQSALSKELQAAKDRLTNNTGSSQIATDILNYGIELKNKGIQKYSDFLKKMKSKFADVWDKIKGAMKALWDSMPDIRNERGEIRIGMDDEFDQEAYDFVAEYYGKEEADKQFKITKAKPKAETKSEPEDDVFARNRAINVRSKSRAFTDLKEVISEIAEGADKLLGSVSTRLGNISQELKAKVRKLDFDIGTKSKNDLVKLKPLLDKAKQRMSRRDYADWDFARKNSYKDKIEELIEKYDLGNEYKEYREVLDRLYNEAEDVGLDIGYIQDYAPRVLKNKKGFLKEVYKSKDWDIYSRALKQRAAERGITVSQMSDDQKADIISNMVAGGFSGIGGVGPTKARKIKEIPPEWNRFYMDSDAALVAYIHSMRKNIEARQFFGKVPEKVSDAKRRLALAETKLQQATDSKRAAELRDDIKEYKEIIENYKYQRDYTQNIGTYIMELMDAGVIEGSDEATVNEILNARFHERGTQGGWQTYKNIEYIDTMGSISSALTQIGDFAWAAYEGGMIKTAKNFGKALTGKSKITKEDIGMDRIAQEFADASTVSKAVNFVFKWTGLTKMDSLAKETLIANSLEKYQKRAKNNDAKLRDELSPIFGKETNSVIKELQDGAVSDNIKLLVYSRVLDFQPMALSEMPQKYLTAGNGRVFYMLKTYTLKQWDVYRNEVYNKLKNGDRSEKIQAIQNLAKLAMLLALANGGANELKDFILRRKTSFKDQVFDTLWRLAGASRFITWQVRREGFGTALAKQILPPFKFIDSLSKDLLSKEVGVPKTLESLTFIGKIMYWHMKADEEE